LQQAPKGAADLGSNTNRRAIYPMITLHDHEGRAPAIRLADGRAVPADNITGPVSVEPWLATEAAIENLAACLRREGLDGDRVAQSTSAVIRHLRSLADTRSGPHGYATLTVTEDDGA
jgi:hypothetical protein